MSNGAEELEKIESRTRKPPDLEEHDSLGAEQFEHVDRGVALNSDSLPQ